MIGLLNFASFVAQIAMRRAARERLIPNMQCPKLGTKTNSGAGGQRRRMRIGTGEVPMESARLCPAKEENPQNWNSKQKRWETKLNSAPKKTTAEDCGRVRIPDRETSKAARAHQKSPVKDGGRKE